MAKTWELWRALFRALLEYYGSGGQPEGPERASAIRTILEGTTRGRDFLRQNEYRLEDVIGFATIAMEEAGFLKRGPLGFEVLHPSPRSLNMFASSFEEDLGQLAGDVVASLLHAAPSIGGVRQPRVETRMERLIDAFFVEQSDAEGDPADRFTFGNAVISIPRKHRKGVLEQPILGWRILENRRKHCVVVEEHGFSSFASFQEGLASGQTGRDMLIYVHGFNTTSREAKMRAAQFAADTDFSGRAVAYIWPSAGSIYKYSDDRAKVPRAADGLSSLLAKLLREGWSINVLAHSMGALVAGWGIQALVKASPTAALQEIVFAAADARDSEFNSIVQSIHPHARRLTLYASARDHALFASHFSNDEVSPVGLCYAGNIYTNPFVEAIDATEVWRQFLALDHSYVFGSYKLLADLADLFLGAAQTRRLLEATSTPNLWRFPPTT